MPPLPLSASTALPTFISAHPRLTFAALCFAGSALMAFIAYDAMRQGYIDLDNRNDSWWRLWSNRLTAEDNPIQFWIQIIIHWIASLALAILGILFLAGFLI